MAHLHTARSSKLTLRISRERWDFQIFTLWSMITFVQFPGDELLLYPLALYYLYSIWRDQTRIVPLLARSWIFLLFPLWCLISPLWALYPLDALKNAVYLCLTMAICYQVAVNLSPRQIMHAICLATCLITLIHLFYVYVMGNHHVGIFPSKNTMGKNMVVLWTATFATFLDRGTHWPARFAALTMAGCAMWLAGVSNSATAVILILASGLLLAFGALLLRGGLLRASRIVAVFLFFGLLFTAAVAVLPYQEIDPVEMLLSHFGKDSTLTGRTGLWQYAEDQIREHPVLGVGHGGFWRYQQSPLVQRIYFEYYKTPGSVFNFHNSAYEITVHQGFIGLGLAALALLAAVLVVTRWTLTEGSLPSIYIFSHMLVVMVRIMTESDFLKPFVMFHMVLWIGALVAIGRWRKAR